MKRRKTIIVWTVVVILILTTSGFLFYRHEKAKCNESANYFSTHPNFCPGN